jgi:hypothetical protein
MHDPQRLEDRSSSNVEEAVAVRIPKSLFWIALQVVNVRVQMVYARFAWRFKDPDPSANALQKCWIVADHWNG